MKTKREKLKEFKVKYGYTLKGYLDTIKIKNNKF